MGILCRSLFIRVYFIQLVSLDIVDKPTCSGSDLLSHNWGIPQKLELLLNLLLCPKKTSI